MLEEVSSSGSIGLRLPNQVLFFMLLFYPRERVRKKLGGDLILDVALNFDGSVNEITLRRPSGHKILDDAAIRIVHLAAPFAPFPADLTQLRQLCNKVK